jgi:hypothetical protein
MQQHNTIKIFKYQSINKYTLAGLNQAQLWACKPSDFNDPFEFRLKRSSTAKGLEEFRKTNCGNPEIEKMTDSELTKFGIEEYEKEFHKLGVVCFSKANNSILMWTHYSDQHKGICLEFALKNGQSIVNAGFHKIEYTKKYPAINFEKVWCKDGESLAEILWTKSEEWDYEREFRLIIRSGGKLIDYPPQLQLSGIIFGFRTSKKNKKLIKDIFKGKDINFQQIQLVDEEFRLEAINI